MTKPSDLYEYSYEQKKIAPKNRTCSRCGRFMARHTKPSPRWACGYCGYTEFMRQ